VVESTEDLMKMNRFLFLFVLAIGVLSFIYIFFLSPSNPRIIELILGVVTLGIVIGIVSSLVYTFFHRQVENHPKKAISFAFCCLLFVLALLLFSSNTPKILSRDIPVTYLVNPNTGEMPYSLYFQGQTTSISYRDVVSIFKQFGERSPEKAEDLLSGNPVSMRIFRDLTEYLIPYFIGTTFTTSEVEPTMYRKTTRKWFGKPHLSITDQPTTIDDISGPLGENLFYGIKTFPDTKIEMDLPKNTQITLERDGDFITTIVFKNRFQEISIGIQLLLTTSGGGAYLAAVFLPPPPLLPPSFADELKVLYKSYNTIIHFDVKFSRLWYGHPDMQYYEEWANSLLSLLERKFGWGSPNLYDPFDPYQR